MTYRLYEKAQIVLEALLTNVWTAEGFRVSDQRRVWKSRKFLLKWFNKLVSVPTKSRK